MKLQNTFLLWQGIFAVLSIASGYLSTTNNFLSKQWPRVLMWSSLMISMIFFILVGISGDW